MNYDCVLLDDQPISIGNNCMIAPGVHIYTATHPTKYLDRNSKLTDNGWVNEGMGKAITIDDNVWIGGRSVLFFLVLPSVIAAGSIVTRNVPPNTIYGGNPAKFIKYIDQ